MSAGSHCTTQIALASAILCCHKPAQEYRVHRRTARERAGRSALSPPRVVSWHGDSEVRQGKRSTNSVFWVRISSGGVGVFHVIRVRVKNSVCPAQPRETKLIDIPGFSPGYPRGMPEEFEREKEFVFISRPLRGRTSRKWSR